MILDSIGAGLLVQNDLYTSNHNHNSEGGWATDPDGLNYTMNHLKPAGHNPFVVYSKDNEIEASEKIVYTLWKYSVATGTLIYSNGHWIVVRGVSTDVEPKPGNTYDINGFWINNPWPYCPSFDVPADAPPPPHSTTDNCGTGGNRGINNEYVAYDPNWKDDYLVGFTGKVGSTWQNRYVSVCDPEVPKMGKLTKKRQPYWARGDKILSTKQVIKFLSRGIEHHALHKDKFFAKALKVATPQDPILVQRLDLMDSYYYQIPMSRKGGISAMMSVDGRYGNFRGGVALAKPVKRAYANPKKVVERLMKHPIDLGEKRGKLILRKGTFCIHPVMVWRPCQESRSPHYPFSMITVGNHQIYIAYDGKVYAELHDLEPGG